MALEENVVAGNLRVTGVITAASIGGGDISFAETGLTGAAATSGIGGVGGNFARSGGTGGTATTGTGGVGGASTSVGGTGGAATGAAGIGGAGGAVTLSSGTGGAASDAASGVGGAAGLLTISGGVGGATAGTTAATGGAGGSVAIAGGAGGAAAGGTSNGGAGGSITLAGGTGGTSAGGTAGAKGTVTATGLIQKSFQASAIAGARTLTGADSGGVFTVAKTSAYAITLPTPAQGINFKFMVLDAGANAVTITDGSAHFMGVVDVAGTPVIMTGTTLSLVATGGIGDWVSMEGIDATHYLVNGTCVTAAKITMA